MKAGPNVAASAAAILSLGVVAGLLWYFHDRFWWPVDEGVYAYVAQRMLAGDVVHRDLVDLHGGYGNYLNALAFVAFGEDLRSLRYPLVAATLAGCLITFQLLASRGALVAASGSIAVGAFSFIQFLNPSANWHALLLFFLMALLLDRCDPRRAHTLIFAGILIGVCFLVRQLSGVILGLGALTWLLLRPNESGRSGMGGLVLAVVMLLGLGGYLVSKHSGFGIVAFGVWPVGLLLCAAVRNRMAFADAARIIALLGLGALIAATPLIVVHALEGALVAWLRDILFTALLIGGQDFITQMSFGPLLAAALINLFTGADSLMAANGLFWILVLMVYPLVGVLVLARTFNSADKGPPNPLPVLAVFWGLVALHYQIPIYLFFALPAAFAALLWLRPQRSVALAVLALSAWAVVFHAGQPLSRGLDGIVAGHRVPLTAPTQLPRVSLIIEEADQRLYSALLDRIEAIAAPEEPLMTVPMEPQLNFMTGRPAPVRYYGTPLGLRDERDVADTLARLRAAAPLFVVHRRKDKYLTELSAVLLAEIRALTPPPERFGPFDLYRLPAP